MTNTGSSGIGPKFVTPLIPGISPHCLFTTVQQLVGLSNVVHVGRCGAHAMDYARLRVHPDVRLHPEAPLVPLPGLVHLRVPLPSPVLGGRRRRDDGGVHDGALPQLQPLGLQALVDLLQQTLPQAVVLQ